MRSKTMRVWVALLLAVVLLLTLSQVAFARISFCDADLPTADVGKAQSASDVPETGVVSVPTVAVTGGPNSTNPHK